MYRINTSYNPSAANNKAAWNRIRHLPGKYTLCELAARVGEHTAACGWKTGTKAGDAVAFVVYLAHRGYVTPVRGT